MLVKGQSRLDGRKYSFFPKRTVNEWNEMSADCVHSSGSNTFKNSIQLYRKSRIHLDSYMWTLHKPTASLSRVIRAIAWMPIVLNSC